MVDIKPGQIWKENDPRVERQVRVLVVNGIWVTVENTKTLRKATANSNRFNGHRKGYSLIEDVK